MSNIAKLKDGTELKVGMFVEDSQRAYCVYSISDNVVCLFGIGYEMSSNDRTFVSSGILVLPPQDMRNFTKYVPYAGLYESLSLLEDMANHAKQAAKEQQNDN
jgi:hypothetical protein